MLGQNPQFCLKLYRQLRARPRALRDVFANVSGQHFVDQRLVTDAPTTRFLAELIEHAGTLSRLLSTE